MTRNVHRERGKIFLPIVEFGDIFNIRNVVAVCARKPFFDKVAWVITVKEGLKLAVVGKKLVDVFMSVARFQEVHVNLGKPLLIDQLREIAEHSFVLIVFGVVGLNIEVGRDLASKSKGCKMGVKKGDRQVGSLRNPLEVDVNISLFVPMIEKTLKRKNGK